MAKKKGGGGGANWMDTYGDMVTLLLCFFVLLYSMSTIDENKWKALVQSFNPNAIPTMTDPEGQGGPIADPNIGEDGTDNPDEQQTQQMEIDQIIEDLYQAILDWTTQEGLTSSVQVSMNGGKVYVKFSDTVFFLGDSYVIQAPGRAILTKFCEILDHAADAIEEVRIQGHTAQGQANVPNDEEFDRFLASNRATEVGLFIQQNSVIHPARIATEGRGQWWPISSNETAETRAFNRRVEIIISGRDLDEEALGNAISQYITASDSTENSTDNDTP